MPRKFKKSVEARAKERRLEMRRKRSTYVTDSDMTDTLDMTEDTGLVKNSANDSTPSKELRCQMMPSRRPMNFQKNFANEPNNEIAKETTNEFAKDFNEFSLSDDDATFEMSKKKMKAVSNAMAYKFRDDLDLEKLIQLSISDLCDPDKSLKARNFETDLQQIQTHIKTLETTQRQINRIFTNCQNQLDNFKESLEETEKVDEEALTKAKEAARQAVNQPSEITIVDSDEDDDDDVQFIQKTYDPDLAAKRLSAQKQASATTPAPANQLTGQQQTLTGQTRAQLVAALSNAGQQQQQQATPGQTPAAAFYQKKLGQPNYSSSLANQEKMEQAFLIDLNLLKVGDRVLGQRQTLYDIWETATIQDILLHTEPVGERRYKVRFEGKKMPKTLLSKQTAIRDSINKPVTVGTRIVALYRDELNTDQFYAGVVAEAPNGRNELRYLVFFDDGYAQYCSSKEIHKVFFQNKQVWDDIHEDSQDFVKDYLAQYPERPMVRLHPGQTVKTEWKGKWWTARVEEVDASLVQMYFPADRRTEWIYRGSTRLEPLFTALANAEANRQAGKGKRHGLTAVSARKPVVEYTMNQPADATATSPGKPAVDKKKSTARKSTTPRMSTEDPAASVLNTGQVWEAPWMKTQKKVATVEKKPPPPKVEKPAASNNKPAAKDMASVLQERLSVSEDAGSIDLESLGTRLDQLLPMKDKPRKPITPHKCGKICLLELDSPDKFKGNNPLLIPLFCAWERHVGKAKPSGKRYITYRAPCGRRLRNIEECDRFLYISESSLSIDYFCYDIELHVHYEFIPVKTFCDIKDISYGKEHVPISCVNGIDRQYPDYVDYSNQRIPATGVKMNLDPDFLVCCDCTDNCRDRSKCQCIQLTVESSTITNGGRRIRDAGYKHRRLGEPFLSGVYECNPRCGCDRRCANRVVQNGLQNRLQVFKTEKRGWGLRCLDDIPKGGFICIYAGQLLTDQGANEDGQQYGDEYLAELDYIEVVERQKEGYESDVTDLDDDDDEKNGEGEDYSDDLDSDESFKESRQPDEIGVKEKAYRTRQTNKKPVDTEKGKDDVAPSSQSIDDLPDLIILDTDTKPTKVTRSTSKEAEGEPKKKRTGRSTAARFGNLTPAKPQQREITIEDHDDSIEKPSSRDFFSDDQQCYIMDAKSMGNIGRYLNHSCTPCAFVQNVFVDTHDLRFPWIAFFAGQYVSAGTELTWDYNYEVGSVPGKVLYCYCGSADCRGRLL